MPPKSVAMGVLLGVALGVLFLLSFAASSLRKEDVEKSLFDWHRQLARIFRLDITSWWKRPKSMVHFSAR